MLGIVVFALNMWLAFDSGIGEWIRDLELQKFYIGNYILILAAFVIVVSSALGCLAIYSEQNLFMLVVSFFFFLVLNYKNCVYFVAVI